MTDPIGNQVFSNDYQKFVYQNYIGVPLPPVGVPAEFPFKLLGVKKSKKDLEKSKSPLIPIPPKTKKLSDKETDDTTEEL